MTDETTIYVELLPDQPLDERVSAWRPVIATNEGSGVYRLPAEQPAGETWAFPPGSRVRCEVRILDGSEQLLACATATA
jgi:hypothetical protein